MEDLIIVGNVADSAFVADVAHHFHQEEDYSDLISLKSFINTEFCPRYIIEEEDWEHIGDKLTGKTVLIVSTSIRVHTRNDLAMRNFLIARGAKDNGADRVILLEPDLFYSAQDRGPRVEHGIADFERAAEDYKKFDGQPFSVRLYADLLKDAGVDEVLTVHNHSTSVKNVFMDRFSGHYHDLRPVEVYTDYISTSDVVEPDGLVLCAPDRGALPFVEQVKSSLTSCSPPTLTMLKKRNNEHEVSVGIADESQVDLTELEGRDVVILDDMVRTGGTIVSCCRKIREGNPRRIVFFVTHFLSSQEARIKLNDPAIDEIVTTNTIPQILNRDMQGRLRKKMVVLKIEGWIAHYLRDMIEGQPIDSTKPLYAEDMSSKNPRWRGKMGPLFAPV